MSIAHSLHYAVALLSQVLLFLIGLKPGWTTRVHFVNQTLFLWPSFVKRT
jgi:hypothetical protein